MPRRKARFVAGLTVIVACLLYLVIYSSQKMSMHYFTVAELEAREAEFVDRPIKLAGKVVPGSIRKDGRTSAVEFRIWEPLRGVPGTFSSPRTVRYSGIVPDTFRDDADVVLEGKTGADGIFHAETLLAKCPSKYEGKSYQEMQQAHSE